MRCEVTLALQHHGVADRLGAGSPKREKAVPVEGLLGPFLKGTPRSGLLTWAQSFPELKASWYSKYFLMRARSQ